MLLGCDDVEITGITTNLDSEGRRTACVHAYLALAGRDEIPVAAGARVSMTTGRRYESTAGDSRYWPAPIEPVLERPGAAEALLARSLADGATVLAIGALTNLAALEKARPGALRGVKVFVMGGWVDQPAVGLPRWGTEMDFNIQVDTRAAETVAAAAELTLVTLPVTMQAQLSRSHLSRLRACGRVGALLAHQFDVYAEDHGMADLGRAHSGLADDLVDFLYDPVAAAVAVGWDIAHVEPRRLRVEVDHEGVLHWLPDAQGRLFDVVVDLDAGMFTDRLFAALARTDRGG
jgi:inosine-uridine nucleoside N-ribohydrolase